MSLDLLLRLQAAHAFDASPLRHDLGIYHVPFSELAPVASPEHLLAGAALRGNAWRLLDGPDPGSRA